MKDDERYPIAVEPEGTAWIPEEKICTPGQTPAVGPGEKRMDSFPPDYKTANVSQSDRDGDSVVPLKGEGFYAQSPPRRPWWKKPTVILLAVLIFLVICVGIAGGLYVKLHSPHHPNKKDETGKSPSAAQQVTFAQNSTRNSVASSGLFLNDKKTWNMQTYWQQDSGNVQMRMSLDGTTWRPVRNVTFTIPPKQNSPLSATASTDTTGVVYLTLFYLTNTTQIAMVGHACAAGSSSCSMTTNQIVSNLLTVSPGNFTDLAAVNVDDAQDWRVYFQDRDGMIRELAGNSSGFGEGSLIGGFGLNTSSIAAVNVNSTTNNIKVFYVDSLSQALYQTEFVGSWTPPAIVSSAIIASWNPLSGLATCYTKASDQIHVYYTGNDAGIYEFLGNNSSTNATQFAAQPGRNHLWAVADYPGADISAVGWSTEARFFQISQGKLAEGSLSNVTWSESIVGLT
ncbi:hypothetical protein BP5796_08887 [Coleophoma crateriformis]|uniref:Uncharacterized protein n=1 Tax=Coleophoma crateriformis TaxID=565419 RepID=A0A3D8R2Q4_9HELO|nr:hypothetical protein BP5796_08887 [Coleophoma crateriformis]